MLKRKKVLAPEPYFSAGMEVLYRVAISVRMLTAKPEKVSQDDIRTINRLMNAIHNIPESLLENGYWFDEGRIREAFTHIDSLGETEHRTHLIEMLNECIAL